MILLMKLLCAIISVAILMKTLYANGYGVNVSNKRARRAFLSGILAVIVVVFCLAGIEAEKTFFNILWLSAFPEELIKMTIMLLLLQRYKYRSRIDILILFGCIGLGFAFAENVFYSLSDKSLMNFIFARGLISTLGHFSYAIIMGYFVCQALHVAKTRSHKTMYYALAFAIPVLIHWMGNVNKMLLPIGSIGIFLELVKYIVMPVIVFRIIKRTRFESVDKMELIQSEQVSFR